jgi:hypothetical protein
VLCVLASALYTMTAGVALLMQGLRSAGDHSTLQEVWDARLKHTRMSHLILIYDNHTRLEL